MEFNFNNHPDLIVERAGNGWTLVRLNRPKTLHALDESICLALQQVFETLKTDEQTRAIWLDSTTSKAFCAGGDVRKIREYVQNGKIADATNFFKAEYALDLMLHEYAKPIVVWGEGYLMGGGMGLFMAAPFRIVTPQSKLAMPEINIGLFADVGGTRFLADIGHIGLFLGLTGSQVGAASSHAIGWATHIAGIKRDEALAKLIAIDWQQYAAGAFRAIDDTLNSFHRPLSSGSLQNSLDVVHGVCRGEDFRQDFYAITGLIDARSEWLREAASNLSNGSPSTAALTWLLWQWGKNRPWQEVFALEQQLATWKIKHPDFVEGVRARLVDKDLSPKWHTNHWDTLLDALGVVPDVPVESWQAVLKEFGVKA